MTIHPTTLPSFPSRFILSVGPQGLYKDWFDYQSYFRKSSQSSVNEFPLFPETLSKEGLSVKVEKVRTKEEKEEKLSCLDDGKDQKQQKSKQKIPDPVTKSIPNFVEVLPKTLSVLQKTK